MKLSPEKKKEVLLQSFEILKGNYLENKWKLADIVAKMFAIDIETAVEMWLFLLKKYGHFLKDENEEYHLTTGIAYHTKLGESKIYDIVLENEPIKRAILNESADPSNCSISMIHYYMYSNNPAIVNEILELVFTNRNFHKSFGEYLENALDEKDADKPISEETFNVLMFWADKVKNKQEKAKINVALLDLATEDEDDEDDDE